MPPTDIDRNLLFGVLALQRDMIDQARFAEACSVWALAIGRQLVDVLIERAWITDEDRRDIERDIERKVRKHGGDVRATLGAIAGADARDAIRAVDQPEIRKSLSGLPPARGHVLIETLVPPNRQEGTRYTLTRLHAEGGLGKVWVARDGDLNREVALKEIRPEGGAHAESWRRFLKEAQITGQLEHPNIVPIYELARRKEDDQPFYTMRFIRGQTLREAIAKFQRRGGPADRLRLQELLAAFINICQAVGYAHSRGVVHRDLKPENVVLGGFGEVIVLDWGLAKILDEPEQNDGAPRLFISAEAMTTPTIGTIGTPQYMAPEQVEGRHDLVDRRTDIYALGGILFEILTGRPPAIGETVAEIYGKILSGSIPRSRDLASTVSRPLDAICARALARERAGRYARATDLAEDVRRWVADEPVTAYREPWTKRTMRWARKHRTKVTVIAATSMVAVLLVGAYAWTILDRTRHADATGLATLARAELVAAEASKTFDSFRWREAIAEARRAEAQLEYGGGGYAAKSRVWIKLAEMEEALRVVERDQAMIAELDQARLSRARERDGEFDAEAMVIAILTSFRYYGIDLSKLSSEEAASLIRASRIASELVAALDEATPFFDENGAKVLSAVARLADTTARGSDIRERISRRDFEGLRHLVADATVRRELGAQSRTIFNTLATLDPTASLPLLEAIHRQNRADFWLTHNLAMACQQSQPPRLESAIRYYYAAAALKPTSPGVFVNLGVALWAKGETEAAIAAYREAIRLNPDFALAHCNLGDALRSQSDLDGAIAACREAIRLKPGYPEAHVNLSLALLSRGDLEGVIAACREAIRLKPDYSEAHNNLAVALESSGDLDGAIAAYREAIRLKPDLALPHYSLGVALKSKGDLDGAVASYREAIRLDSNYAWTHGSLGFALLSRGDLDGAIAACREAIRLKPDYFEAHNNLGFALESSGDLDGAIVAFREAIRLKPENSDVHSNLGDVLRIRGDLDGAIAACREAIRLKPDSFKAHNNLGLALLSRGDLDGAITACREAIRLKPDEPTGHNSLGVSLKSKGDLDGAIAAYREAIRLKSDYADAYCNLGLLLITKGRFVEALESLERGHELGSKKANWDHPSAEWVRACLRLVDLDARLPALLKGGFPSLEPGEKVEFADLCYIKALYAASVRLYAQAFTDQPDLAEDLNTGYRFEAASAAVLAGSGLGKDDPPPDSTAMAMIRAKALGWLRADLMARGKLLDGGDANARQALVSTLDQWKQATDLTGIRDAQALAKLPEGEREEFRTLWKDVEALRRKAVEEKPE